MVIYFEGLSCAGKTTIINEYKKIVDPSVHVIPEFLGYPDKSQIDFEINNDYCQKNDLMKAEEIIKQKESHEKIFVDRGHGSTLAYNYILYKLKTNRDYETILNWYMKNITLNMLAKPDLYIYLEMDEELAIKRAYASGAQVDKYAWYKNPQFASNFYETFFSYIEPEVDVIRIDASKNKTEIVHNIKQYLNEHS